MSSSFLEGLGGPPTSPRRPCLKHYCIRSQLSPGRALQVPRGEELRCKTSGGGGALSGWEKVLAPVGRHLSASALGCLSQCRSPAFPRAAYPLLRDCFVTTFLTHPHTPSISSLLCPWFSLLPSPSQVLLWAYPRHHWQPSSCNKQVPHAMSIH